MRPRTGALAICPEFGVISRYFVLFCVIFALQLPDRASAAAGSATRHSQIAAANGNPSEVGTWQQVEFLFVADSVYGNPWLDASLTGVFASPAGDTLRIEGFWDGGQIWRLRFAAPLDGLWQFHTESGDSGLISAGELQVRPATFPGPLRQRGEDPTQFAHADGSPFFWMGTTSYGLVNLPPADVRAVLRYHRSQKFNAVRTAAYWFHEEAIPFGGTLRNPEYDRINPAYFVKLDSVIEIALQEGMLVELILEMLYAESDLFRFPPLTRTQEERYLKYIIARYSASPSIALWTLANEYELYPNGKYEPEQRDIDWVRARTRFIKDNDPYAHLTSVHPFDGYVEGGPPVRGRSSGDLYGNHAAIDVLTQQSYGSNSGASTDVRSGVGRGLGPTIAWDRKYGKPVINAEFGYARFDGRNNNPPANQQFSGEYLRRAAWRIVLAGGFLSTGFDGTITTKTPEIDTTGNAIEAGYFTFLHDFMTRETTWPTLIPDKSFARAEDFAGMSAPDRTEYLLYLPTGGEIDVLVPGHSGELTAVWIDPAKECRYPAPAYAPGELATYVSPAPPGTDVLLWLRAEPDAVAEPPEISAASAAAISPTRAMLNVTVSSRAAVSVQWRSGNSEGGTLGTDGHKLAHAFLLTDLQPATLYTYAARASDMRGRVGAVLRGSFVTPEGESQPPAIENISTEAVAGDAFVVRWSTSEPATSLLEFGVDTTFSIRRTATDVPSTGHGVELEDLEVGQSYLFRVVATDESGNTTISAPDSFTVDPAAAFALRINSGGDGYTDAAGQPWSADQKHRAGRWGYLDGNTAEETLGRLGSEVPAHFRTERWRLSGYRIPVPAEGTYRVELHFVERNYERRGQRIFHVDIEGQPALESFDILAETSHLQPLVKTTDVYVRDGVLDITFRRRVENPFVNGIAVILKTIGDAAPPVLAETRVVNATSRSAYVVWKTDEPARGELRLGLTPALELPPLADSQLIAHHAFRLTSLSPATQYYFQATAADVRGNESNGTVRSFTTADAEEAPPPGGSGDVDGNSALQPFDALQTLEHVVGAIALTGSGLQAANFTGDSSISAFDAAMILRAAGGGAGLPGGGGTIPFAGVLDPAPGRFTDDSAFKLPLRIEAADTLHAFEAVFGYDPSVFFIEKVVFLPAPAVYLAKANIADGKIRVAYASEAGWQGGQLLLELNGRVLSAGARTLRLEQLRWNEEPVLVPNREFVLDISTGLSLSRLPERFGLHQNYPNPFNPKTRIAFELPATSSVQLAVFDMLGREVVRLVDGRLAAGTHEILFDARRLASGVYFYRLEAGGTIFQKKMLLLR